MEAARELGGKLFEAIFSGEVRACIRSSLNEIYRQEGTGLRLKLRLQEVAELADLPWEFLFDSSLDRFIAQSNQTPIVRYVEMHERITALTVNLPLRVLVMISSPYDYARLDVERERPMLQEALEPLSKNGKVRVEWLDKATLAALQRCLRDGEYHVFHFIGHGGFDKKREEGVLVLEDEQERGWLAGAHRIGTLLHDHRSLRLAVLNCCEGARNSRTDPFAGVATTLIRQGVPAVVAMQFEITDEAAITFAHEFYTALAEGFPVDAAVAEARKAIYAQPNDVEWGTPVLYMRSPDGVLFSIQEHEEPEHQRHEQIATLYKQARGLVLVGQWQQASEKMKEIRALDPQFADPEGIALRVQEELARKEPKQDRTKPFRLPSSFEIAIFGCIGGVIAGLIIGVIYYYTSTPTPTPGVTPTPTPKEYLGWFIILEVVVYASLIGTTVSILSQLCILWFHRLVSERRYPALVFNEVSGGILGGVITGILFGALGGGYFGLR